MSEQIKLIKSLLDYVEEYNNERANSDLKEFSSFLSEKIFLENSSPQNEFDAKNYKNYTRYPEVEFSTLLTGLYRFAKHYIKKALNNLEIKTIDEFGFLASLMKNKSMLKKELFDEHHIETSSGSEILKRMLKLGLIEEVKDEKDKRAKRVSLTPLGIQTTSKAFLEMHKVSEIVIGNLSRQEIMETLKVFNKLNFFHKQIHQHDQNSDLEDIQAKYLKK